MLALVWGIFPAFRRLNRTGMSEWKEFDEWFTKQLIAPLALSKLEGSPVYRRFLQSLQDAPDWVSGTSRMKAFIRLKYGFPMSSDGYTCVVMTATAGKASAIYALAFVAEQKIAYVCVSPTFDSKDGEYRHRLVPFE